MNKKRSNYRLRAMLRESIAAHPGNIEAALAEVIRDAWHGEPKRTPSDEQRPRGRSRVQGWKEHKVEIVIGVIAALLGLLVGWSKRKEHGHL